MTRQDEHRLASFFADPRWKEGVRELFEELTGVSTAPLEALVRKVRLERWRDRS